MEDNQNRTSAASPIEDLGADAEPILPSGDERPRSPRPVFLSDYIYLQGEFLQLEKVLTDPEARWLDLVAARMTRKGVRPELGGSGIPTRQGRETVRNIALMPLGSVPEIVRPLAAVTVFLPRRRERSVVVPTEWRPVQLESLIPVLEGDLELTELDADSCRLAMNAVYRAPLGRLGLQLDRIAMGRLAESALRRFLEAAGEVLMSAAASG